MIAWEAEPEVSARPLTSALGLARSARRLKIGHSKCMSELRLCHRMCRLGTRFTLRVGVRIVSWLSIHNARLQYVDLQGWVAHRVSKFKGPRPRVDQRSRLHISLSLGALAGD